MALYRRLLAFIAIFLLLAVALVIIFFAVGQREIGNSILKSEQGRLVVADDQRPKTFPQRRQAPAVTLLPGKGPLPVVSGDIDSQDIEPLLAAWENFSPKKIAERQHRRGSDPYRQQVKRIAADSNSADVLYRRLDSSDLPGLCPEKQCSAGWQWVPGSFGGLQLHDYRPPFAYLTGYGLVRYQADQQRSDQRQGQIYYRAYGLLVDNSSGSWRLQRAAAEIVQPVD